jgi:hypothetical protein
MRFSFQIGSRFFALDTQDVIIPRQVLPSRQLLLIDQPSSCNSAASGCSSSIAIICNASVYNEVSLTLGQRHLAPPSGTDVRRLEILRLNTLEVALSDQN